MSKERKQAAIRKPVIDEEAVLRFVAAGAGQSQSEMVDDENVTLTVTIRREVFRAIEREASKKGRSLEETARKALTKQFGKD